MINNSAAYYYTKLSFDAGLFDKAVDMAYILTMEDSTRVGSYMNQLNKYKPLRNVIIQFNKGFKNTNKQLHVMNTVGDLNDAFYHALLHASAHNYNNIIIFEDDFFFDHTMHQSVANEICMFISTNKFHIYNIGSINHFTIPAFSLHHRSLFLSSAHCVIYSREYIDMYISMYNIGFTCPNDMIWNKLQIIKYRYYKPLCFQLHVATLNRVNWICSDALIALVELFNLHKTHQPGYTIYSIMCYIISSILLYYCIALCGTVSSCQ